jgi:hypothetical protein
VLTADLSNRSFSPSLHLERSEISQVKQICIHSMHRELPITVEIRSDDA